MNTDQPQRPPGISPNDTVRIKLTQHGKRLIVASVDRFNDDLRTRGPDCIFRVSVPLWDSNNWLSGQFHSLMSYFDGHWSGCGELPFTEMEKP